MTDMLVKLYNLKLDWEFVQRQAQRGTLVRKPIGPERHVLMTWVKEEFSQAWASETEIAFSNTPRSCFIAINEGEIVGFGCYDATALGLFGPVGVRESHRGRGLGKALLLACLLDMKLKGYGYAIIGSAGPTEFYRKLVGAVEIPESTPGLWETWLEGDG
jgi:GNAT superfamily N-acetyltransferase